MKEYRYELLYNEYPTLGYSDLENLFNTLSNINLFNFILKSPLPSPPPKRRILI